MRKVFNLFLFIFSCLLLEAGDNLKSKPIEEGRAPASQFGLIEDGPPPKVIPKNTNPKIKDDDDKDYKLDDKNYKSNDKDYKLDGKYYERKVEEPK